MPGPRNAAIITVLILAVPAAEMFLLKGTTVLDQRIDVSGGNQVLPLEENGRRHVLEIYAEDKIVLDWTLSDPAGETIESDKESSSHAGRRRIVFTPSSKGNYRFQYVGKLRPYESGEHLTRDGHLRMFVGDYRLLPALLALINF